MDLSAIYNSNKYVRNSTTVPNFDGFPVFVPTRLTNLGSPALSDLLPDILIVSCLLLRFAGCSSCSKEAVVRSHSSFASIGDVSWARNIVTDQIGKCSFAFCTIWR